MKISQIAKELIIKSGLCSIYVRKGKGRWIPAYGAATIGFKTVVVGEKLGTFSESAVRGIIGHELGHIAMNHPQKKVAAAISAIAMVAIGTHELFSAFPGVFETFVQKAPVVGILALTAWLTLKRISRAFEINADRFSAKLNGSAKPLLEYIVMFLLDGRHGASKDAELRCVLWFEKHPIISAHPTLKKRIVKLAELEEKLDMPRETA
ncbi:MAG: M48 family metalloprotease [Candidatus Micrarchaeia archaeon]